jgi:hypothetical protein
MGVIKRNHWFGCNTPAESVGNPPNPQISSIVQISEGKGMLDEAFAQFIWKVGGTSATYFMQGGKRAPKVTFI